MEARVGDVVVAVGAERRCTEKLDVRQADDFTRRAHFARGGAGVRVEGVRRGHGERGGQKQKDSRLGETGIIIIAIVPTLTTSKATRCTSAVREYDER